MPETLLRTKLFVPPLRPNLVRRPQLIERLNQGIRLGHKLTLISAPAGFGKTTLVSEWVGDPRVGAAGESQSAHSVAWLSLDEDDNDPARFLAYLVSTLRQTGGIEATVGQGAQTILQSPQPSLSEEVLTSLINDIAATPGRVILVLDDYHRIDSSPVDKALGFLLNHLPSQVHLVIATREDPNVPLALLRGRGQLTELRATDLRFTPLEAAEFLNQVMGLDLSAEEIASLETRTEGWIAGLQLASLALQGTIALQRHATTSSLIQSFTGSHRFVLDYLIEEVLNQQPTDVRRFLLHTAILDRMTGPLCDAVTGQEDGQVTLEMLERTNLFIVPLDEERRWYRYHHLFGDLLRGRLQRTQSDDIAALHVRAAGWFERNEFITEAVNHALAGRDYDRAARLVEAISGRLLQHSGLQALLKWINALPDELARTEPWLCICQAWILTTWMLTFSGKLDGVEPLLKDVERRLQFDEIHVASPTEQQEMLGNIAVMRSYVAVLTGSFSRSIELATQAEATLTEKSLWARSICQWARGIANRTNGDLGVSGQSFGEVVKLGRAMGDVWTTVIGMVDLAHVHFGQGRLHESAALYREALQLANQHNVRNSSNIGPGLAHVLYEQNDLEAAHRRATEGVQRTRSPNQHVFAYDVLSRVLHAQGDVQGAMDALHKADQMIQEYPVLSELADDVERSKVRIWLAQNNEAAVERWVEENHEEIMVDRGPLSTTLARIYFDQRKLDEALSLLGHRKETAEKEGRNNILIEILVLQALALHAQYNTAAALEPLERSLALAEAEGYVRVFVDEGPPMAHLLSEAVARGIAPDYARKLLAAFPVSDSKQVDSLRTRIAQNALVEPLSEREFEVLQLIAEGLTNPEIASRLYLSLNTVKVHTRNIYGKLDAHSRTQAVAAARALGILSAV